MGGEILTTFAIVLIIFVLFSFHFFETTAIRHSNLRKWVMVLFLYSIPIVTFVSLPVVGIVLFTVYTVSIFILSLMSFMRKQKRKRQQRDITILPEYHLETNLRFYEVGALIDGKVSMQDIIANYIYIKLHPETQLDEVDLFLQETIKETGGIGKYTNRLLKSETIVLTGSGQARETTAWTDYSPTIISQIYTKLTKDGFYNFHPREKSAKLLTSGLRHIFLALFIMAFFQSSLLIVIPITAILASVGLLSMLRGFLVYEFHENFDKILPARKNLLGHKMYLQTTEFYTIQQDQDKFKELIPYFIAYGLHLDKVMKALEEFDLIRE